MTELEYSGMGRNKEQSARLLGHLIANAPKLVKPSQAPILKVKYIMSVGYTIQVYVVHSTHMWNMLHVFYCTTCT